MQRNYVQRSDELSACDIQSIVVILFILIGGAIYIVCYGECVMEPRKMSSKEQYFNERIASLPEVQQLFNLSKLTYRSSMFTQKDHFDHLPVHSNSSAAPESLTQVLTELLLHSVAKQRVLEDRIEILQESVEGLGALLLLLIVSLMAYGIYRCCK